jgi:hypothetical protein
LKKTLYKIFILLLIAAALLSSCSPGRKGGVTRAVYFWKTTFSLSENDKSWLNNNRISRIYLRLFDVDWNPAVRQAVPVGDVSVANYTGGGFEIVPVVFITNRTLLNISDSAVEEFAFNIMKKVEAKEVHFGPGHFKEIQLDCDWSEKTKEKYFALLKTIKSNNKLLKVSATIRLHQVKYYHKTGVPPVDRGMLMFYNMGDVTRINTTNSIFDEETAKNYLYNFDKYPLELDVVLPAFGWTTVYENGRLVNLINEATEKTLKSQNCYRKIAENQYICRTDNTINGIQIKANSILKIEEVSPEMTDRAASIIAKYIHNEKPAAALYYFNQNMVRNYDNTKIENIYSHFN